MKTARAEAQGGAGAACVPRPTGGQGQAAGQQQDGAAGAGSSLALHFPAGRRLSRTAHEQPLSKQPPAFRPNSPSANAVTGRC